MRTLLIALLLAPFAALAHDHTMPEYDDWFKSLTNQNGGACCDGSDAYSVKDPDWETTADAKKPYRVFLKTTFKPDGEWIDVPADAVVRQQNRIGTVKVWPVMYSDRTLIRCFMPGALT